ncbi:MAG: terminase [archaeon]|nr:terminase [archaeon]
MTKAEEIIVKPQEGPQMDFLSSSADIVIYGGAAGGGKTWGLLLEPLRHITTVPGFGAVIFRRTSPQITNEGALWDEADKLYPCLDAKSNKSDRKYTFPPHYNKVTFSHLEHEKNKLDWQGAQIPLILFDELTHFTEGQFWYLLSRNRTMCGIKPYVRATCNPDPDSFVAKLIEWWIDQETGFAIPERSGVIRYFLRINDTVHWGDTKKELEEKFAYIDKDIEHEDERTVLPKSFTFIAAKLTDNKILMRTDPEYKATLLALPLVEREQLLGGNWKIRPAAGLYFSRDNVQIVEPEEVPEITKQARGWDLAATDPDEKKNKTGKPDWTASVKGGLGIDKYIYIQDLTYKQHSPVKVRETVKNKASHDGSECIIRLPQDPGQAGKDQIYSYRVDVLPGYNVKARSMRGDKVTRAGGFSSAWENNRIRVVRGPWNDLLFTHLENFPPVIGSPDIVDAGVEMFHELNFGIQDSNDDAIPVVNVKVDKQVKRIVDTIQGLPQVEGVKETRQTNFQFGGVS